MNCAREPLENKLHPTINGFYIFVGSFPVASSSGEP